jgi:hypothetical protein
MNRIVAMIQKIKNWIKIKRVIRSIDATGIAPVPFSGLEPIAQEDTRAINNVKEFNKAFDQQEQQMQARALVAHEPGCDVISCNKVSCFKHEPDKVVSDTKPKRKRTKKPIQGD